MSRRTSVGRDQAARIVYGPQPRKEARNSESSRRRELGPGAWVRSVALIRNDGTYPHKDVGEPLIYPGDTGVVRQSWRFLGEVYYTVDFIGQAVFVIMRDREMARIGEPADRRA